MKPFKPVGSHLILQPSASMFRGRIAIPEIYARNTSMCRVIEMGSDVNPFIKRDSIVFCQRNFSERKSWTIEGTNFFACRNNNIFAMLRNGLIFPFGRTILIRRHMKERKGQVIEQLENRRYQSLEGEVVRLGLTRKHFRVNDIHPGDEVVLKSWEAHMTEVDLEDRTYGLIVNETDLLYKHSTPCIRQQCKSEDGNLIAFPQSSQSSLHSTKT